MRNSVVLAMALSVVIAAPGSAEPPELGGGADLIQVGRALFLDRCVSCHFVPDRTIERDRIWLEHLRTTA